MTRASERNGELQLRMRVRISAHVLKRCFGALRMCLCPLLHHDQCEAIQTTVGNQQKWDKKRAERSGAVLRCGELPEDLVVLSSPFDCLGFYLPSAL